MPSLSSYSQSGIINSILRNGSFPKPATLALALCSSVPTFTQNGATIPELPNAGGYARYTIGVPADIHFVISGTANNGTVANNTSGIQFPQCASTWGWVSGVGLLDSSTYGAGALLGYAQLPVPKYVTSSDYVNFVSGALTFTMF